MRAKEFREIFCGVMRSFGYLETEGKGPLLQGYYYGDSSLPEMAKFWSVAIAVKANKITATISHWGPNPTPPEYDWYTTVGWVGVFDADLVVPIGDDPKETVMTILTWASKTKQLAHLREHLI